MSGAVDAEVQNYAGRVLPEIDGVSYCTTFALTRAGPNDDWPVEPEPLSVPPAPVVQPEPATPPVVARVDGRDIRATELDLHAQATGLPRDRALDDLIDLVLVENAASARSVAVPPRPWAAGARAAVEKELAGVFGIASLSRIDDLIVDHVWVRDAPSKNARAQQRQAIDKLRALVLAGRGVEEAWRGLGLDGTSWHVAENEQYPAPVLPEGAQKLVAGDVSEVLPGDGGLHLCKVRARRPQAQALAIRREALLNKLRAAAKIERFVRNE